MIQFKEVDNGYEIIDNLGGRVFIPEGELVGLSQDIDFVFERQDIENELAKRGVSASKEEIDEMTNKYGDRKNDDWSYDNNWYDIVNDVINDFIQSKEKEE